MLTRETLVKIEIAPPFVDALLILKCRLSEHVEARNVTACLIYPVSSVFLRRVFGSADHSGADRTLDRA